VIFTLQRPQIALFLNRLFATDGWATVLASGHAQLGYASVSERLARQIQHLLLRFGVIASLGKRNVLYKNSRPPAWQLDITDGRSIQTFISEIGIFGKERAVAAVQSALRKKKYQTNRDLIPREIWHDLASAKGTESSSALARRSNLRGHTNIHVGKRALTRDRLSVLADSLGNSKLENLASSDVYWDEIVSIEPVGLKQVYDLTIPETHNFVANDICVHNTSLAMNIAEHVALELSLPVGVFSLEMSASSLILRMLCSLARVNMRNIREGFMSEADFPKLMSASGRLAGAKLLIDDTAGLSILQLRARARRMHQQHGIKLFVIDYLQLLNSTARRAQENRQQEIADISSGIKALAKELNVPVIVLSQLNRELEKDKSRKPRLSDLRESGSIEQDADLVGLLYKPNAGDDDDGAAQEESDGVAVNFLIAKQRNGPTGDVNLTFLKPYTRFESAAKFSDEDVPAGR
jgi:replicative DNA helicase